MNYSKAQNFVKFKYMVLQSDLHLSFMVSKIECPLQVWPSNRTNFAFIFQKQTKKEFVVWMRFYRESTF